VNPIAPHRDDGPVSLLARGWLPIPEVLLLTLAASAPLAPLTAVSDRLAWPGPAPAWTWIAAAWTLAVLASLGRVLPRLQWPVPALLRAVEYGGVLALGGASPWTYALLLTLAFHHYDIVYRVRLLGTGPPRWLGVAGGGWPVRLAVLVAAAAVGWTSVAVQVLTVLLAALFTTESVRSWWSAREPAAGS
jgi:hypothetical protein